MISNKLFNAAVLLSAMSINIVACSQQASRQVAATPEQSSSSIIGGVRVDSGDVIAKSTVAIVAVVTDNKDQQQQFICTGSLLSKNIVLTAGHCVPSQNEYKKAALYVIFSTDLNQLDAASIRPVTNVAVHPLYGKGNPKVPSNSHDVALIRFEGDKADGYEIANLLTDYSVLKQGASVTLAGYGINKTDGEKTEGDNTLRKTDVQVYQDFGATEVILDQTQGKGACHGDSGGPAFVEIAGTKYLWGITSRGVGQNNVDDCSLISIYTKIDAEKVFIDKAFAYLSQDSNK